MTHPTRSRGSSPFPWKKNPRDFNRNVCLKKKKGKSALALPRSKFFRRKRRSAVFSLYIYLTKFQVAASFIRLRAEFKETWTKNGSMLKFSSLEPDNRNSFPRNGESRKEEREGINETMSCKRVFLQKRFLALSR